MGKAFIWSFVALFILGACQKKDAQNLNIAVASSMGLVAEQTADILQKRNPQCVLSLSIAGSSSLYNSFSQGADYHIFMGADDIWPQKFRENFALESPAMLYAKGQAVLWLRYGEVVDIKEEIVISHPQTTPYGQAAYQWLNNEKLWNDLEKNKNIITAGSAAKVAFVVNQGGFKQAILPLAFLEQLPKGKYQQPIADMQHFMISLKPSPCGEIWQDFIEKDDAFKAILTRQNYQSPKPSPTLKDREQP